MKKNLTISIVNFNSGEYLVNCLESLSKVKNELSFEVYVADNNSTDDSFEKAKNKYPDLNFISNKVNLGFGKAHNMVLKKSDSSYLLILNPDTKVPAGTLKAIFEFMQENLDAGIASSKVEKEDGSLDKASHRGFPTPMASFKYFFLKNDKDYHMTYKNMNEIHEVDSVVGAFMFCRKKVLDEVGYFDQDYFLYGEDIDLCFRVKGAGYKVMYLPQVSVKHFKGISSGIKKHSVKESNASDETKIESTNYFYETMKIFYKKHYAKNYPAIFNWFVYKGIDLKLNLSQRKQAV